MQGEKGGGGHPMTTLRACILVTAPTNVQANNLMWRVIRSAEEDPAFMQEVLKDHPAAWMRLRAARGRISTDLRPYNRLTGTCCHCLRGVPSARDHE